MLPSWLDLQNFEDVDTEENLGKQQEAVDQKAKDKKNKKKAGKKGKKKEKGDDFMDDKTLIGQDESVQTIQ